MAGKTSAAGQGVAAGRRAASGCVATARTEPFGRVGRRRTANVFLLACMTLLLACAALLAAPQQARAAEEPSVSQFATAEELLTFDTDDTDAEGDTNAAKVYFGQNGSGDAQTWWIVGQDPSENGGLVLFAASPLTTNVPFSSSTAKKTYAATGDTVYPNHYGASDLFIKLQEMETSDAYFSAAEQTLMRDTTVWTDDQCNSKNYSTTGKLYAVYGEWIAGRNTYLTAGTNSDSDLNGGLRIDSSYWYSDYFCLRAPYPGNTEFWGGRCLAAKSGSVIVDWYVNSSACVVPALQIDPSSVLFGSTAPDASAVSSDGALATDDAFTLRYDADELGVDLGSAAVSDDGSTVYLANVPSDAYLVAQNSAGAWAVKVGNTANISASGLGLDSFDGCEVWLEMEDSDTGLLCATMAGNELVLDVSEGGIVITSTGYSIGGTAEVPYVGPYTITGKTSGEGYSVTVKSGDHGITIRDLSIDTSGFDGVSAFSIESGASVDLTLEGENVLKSGERAAGLQVSSGASLTVTAASEGSLESAGGYYGAGIGGGMDGSGGTITISGGAVSAMGGANAAGIGGGMQGSGGTVAIAGGVVVATGSDEGAGIGGGQQGSGGTIAISGGAVSATGGVLGGAGIGGGSWLGAGGIITISGGAVSATGGTDAVGIGGGLEGAGGIITISGGTVSATGGNGAPAIGGNATSDYGTLSSGENGNAVVFVSSSVSANKDGFTSGILFEGDAGTQYGETVAPTEDFEIGSGKTLMLSKGQTLNISKVTLAGSGIVDITAGGAVVGTVPEGITLKVAVDASGLSNISSDGTGTATNQESYTTTLSVDTGYLLPDNIAVTIGGVEYAGHGYSASSPTITIPKGKVTGNITISGAAIYDPTAPTLSDGSGVRTGATTATVSFTADEAGTCYYAMVKHGAEKPDIDTKGEGAACVEGGNEIALDGASSDAFDIYIVVKDAAGNVSEPLCVAVPAWALDAPANLKLASSASGKATAAWDAVDGAASYEVQLYKGDAAAGDSVKVESGTSYDFAITAAGSYRFTVKALPADSDSSRGESATATSGSLTFFAVTFDPTGGSEAPSQEVAYGSQIEKPDDPTRKGYVFKGWYADAAYSQLWDFDKDTVAGGTTLYAQWAYAAPAEGEGYTIGYTTETVNAKDGYEVREGDAGKWTTGSVDVEPGGTFQVRRAADGDVLASKAVSVTLPARPAAPKCSAVAETVDGNGDGKITGLDDGAAYEISTDGETWKGVSVDDGAITGLADGTYYVRLKATDAAFAGDASKVEVAQGAKRTYMLKVADVDFDDATFGYGQPDAKALAITSEGNSAVTVTGVELSGDGADAFELNKTDDSTYTIRPVEGLGAGDYSATVAVTYRGTTADGEDTEDFTAEATVSFSVAASELAAPEGLALSSSGAGKATASWDAVANASGYEVQLYKDGKSSGEAVEVGAGETSHAFGIEASGTYTFTVKALGEGNYADGEAAASDAAQGGRLAFFGVSFDPGEGSGKMTPAYVVDGSSYVLPECGFTAPDGYEFAAWSVGGEEKQPGEAVPVSGDTTVTATWKACTYSVTLHANGGAIVEGEDVKGYTYGVGATLPDDVERTGYTFKGWYDNGACEGDPVKAIPADATGNKAYYAKWEANVYGVTLDAQGGTINSGDVDSYTYGIVTPLPTDVTREGYAFAGWFDEAGNPATEIPADATGDMAFCAEWLFADAGVESVKVSGVAGVASGDGTTFAVTLPYGSSLSADPSAVEVAVVEGAAATEPATDDGGATWKFTVTAEDGKTVVEYTVNVEVAPDPAADNEEAVASAVDKIEGHGWTVDQAAANDEASVRVWLESELAALDLGVSWKLELASVDPATAGDADDRGGSDGSFAFTVALWAGEETGDVATSTYASATASAAGTIAATAYDKWTVAVGAGTGGTASGGGTYDEGDTATVTATPGEGYAFSHWEEDGEQVSADATYSFEVTTNRTLVAVFEPVSDDPEAPADPDDGNEGNSTGDGDSDNAAGDDQAVNTGDTAGIVALAAAIAAAASLTMLLALRRIRS